MERLCIFMIYMETDVFFFFNIKILLTKKSFQKFSLKKKLFLKIFFKVYIIIDASYKANLCKSFISTSIKNSEVNLQGEFIYLFIKFSLFIVNMKNIKDCFINPQLFIIIK